MRRRPSGAIRPTKRSYRRENTKSGGNDHSLPSLCLNCMADCPLNTDIGFLSILCLHHHIICDMA